jgi:hypothetical protein
VHLDVGQCVHRGVGEGKDGGLRRLGQHGAGQLGGGGDVFLASISL